MILPIGFVGMNVGPTELMVFLVVYCICILPVMVSYLTTVQKCLTRCSVETRTMSSGLVWLMLVPFFNMIWQFYIVLNVAKSVHGEFNKRGIIAEPNPGQSIGLAMSILSICTFIPVVNIIAAPVGLVCWIIYWAKVAGFSKQIAQ